MPVETLKWRGGLDGCLRIIDQRALPAELKFLDLQSAREVFDAIRTMAVRGAPAIGIAAGYGAFLGVRGAAGGPPELREGLHRTCGFLRSSRPTGANLFHALDRVCRVPDLLPDADAVTLKEALLNEAHSMLREDMDACRKMGEHCQAFVADGAAYLTNCNAGGLATGGYGTALAAFYVARERGKRVCVYACETRPLLQGARLTAWELTREGIDVTLICDNMAASVLRQARRRRLEGIFVGADRIAANGDVANKIGTYPLAVLAREHAVPFYVVAPLSTFDLALGSGDSIPIEERAPEEVTRFMGMPTAPEGVGVFNPAFDLTPAHLVSAIICETGIVEKPDAAGILRLARARKG